MTPRFAPPLLLAVFVLCSPRPSLAQDRQWIWKPVGADSFIGALIAFDDGAGPALYAAGGFAHIEGVAAARVAKFDGQKWGPVGDGLSGDGVYSAAIHDDGSGPALYVGGVTTPDAIVTENIGVAERRRARRMK